MERPVESGELVYCHECENEWYRAEHGLQCPQCQSEFTEVIENDSDPRDQPGDFDELHGDDAGQDMLQQLHHPVPGQFPTEQETPQNRTYREERGPGHYRIVHSGPHFSVSTTVRGGHTTVTGGSFQSVGGFPGLLGEITRTLMGPASQETHGTARFPPPLQPTPFQGMPHGDAGFMPPFPTEQHAGMHQGGTRFPYDPQAQLNPNMPGHNHPPIHPGVDPLNQLLGNLLAPPAGFPPPHGHPNPGFTATAPPPFSNPFFHMQNQTQTGPLNLGALLGELIHQGMTGHAHQFGDVAYSQEDMDRIISQLMDQTTTSNAPGPATADAIAALPKKKVDDKLLGESGSADCSICMDEVTKGELVTELPCGHWFHEQCVGAWLREHNTCPHCRKGIEMQDGAQASSHDDPATGSRGAGAPASSSSRRSQQRVPSRFRNMTQQYAHRSSQHPSFRSASPSPDPDSPTHRSSTAASRRSSRTHASEGTSRGTSATSRRSPLAPLTSRRTSSSRSHSHSEPQVHSSATSSSHSRSVRQHSSSHHAGDSGGGSGDSGRRRRSSHRNSGGSSSGGGSENPGVATRVLRHFLG